MTAKVYFIFILFLFQAQIFACESEFLKQTNRFTLEEKLNLKLESLNLSFRLQNVFKAMGVTYIGDIVLYRGVDLLGLNNNFGIRSLSELKSKLSELGLYLGMDVGDWRPPTLEEKLNLRLENLNLSSHVKKVLRVMGVTYIGDIVSRAEHDLLKEPGFGKKSLNELKEKLSELGLNLGMDVRGKRSVTLEEKLNLRLENLNLSPHVQNILRVMGVTYIGDIVSRAEHDLLKEPGFGKKSLNELKEKLSELGLNLGMNIGGWRPVALKEKLTLRVDSLHFSSRVQKSLRVMGVTYIGDIVSLTEYDLLKEPGFGIQSLTVLEDKLSELGLYLGMNIGGWHPPAH